MTQIQEIKFTPYIGIIVMGDESRSKNYVQVHNITKDGWGEGKPFDKHDLAHLAHAIKHERVSSLKMIGLVPDNLLYFQPGISGSKFMWYIPPSEKLVNFTAEVKIPSRVYKMPGLIMAVANSTMYVFAFKGSKKPNEKTELFRAPFFNLYDCGSVCMGTVSEARPKLTLHEEMDRWERRFFGGNFTTAHGPYEKEVMKDIYMQARKKFPERRLKPAQKKTLDSFLKHLMTERSGIDE